MWAVITSSGKRCQTKTHMNMHKFEEENQCSLINLYMREADAHSHALLSYKQDLKCSQSSQFLSFLLFIN